MTCKYEFEWVELESTWSEHKGNKGGFRLSWGCKGMSPLGLGWGTVTFYIDHDGKLHCDDELMGLDFVQQALLFFSKQALLRS